MARPRRYVTLTTAAALVAASTIVVTAQAAPLSPPGQLWAWGNADEGILGDGERDCGDGETLLCTPLETLLADVVQVDGGDIHAVALTADGDVYNWGLGDMIAHNGEGGVIAEPRLVDLPEVTFQAVAAGGQHTLALATDGTIWSWGRNASGQLGHGFDSDGDNPFVTTPSQVVAFSDNEPEPLEGIVAIAAGAAHSLALDVNGLVWGWGSDEFGQLGTGGSNGRSSAVFPVEADAGGDDVFSPLTDVIEIAAGDNHSLAVDGGSRVYGWGDNSSGQLGTGEVGGTQTRAFPQSGPFAVDIAGGAAHSLMRGKDGTVYAVGDNLSGQLGIGSFSDPIGTPEPIDGLQASHIAAHGDFSLAIQLGEVFAWGEGEAGQLGIGPADPHASPNVIEDISNATGIGAGREAGYAITEPVAVDPSLSLTVQEANGASGPPGRSEIDLDDVDLATLPLFAGELASAPLRSSPLRSSPLRSSPLRSSPLRSSPLRSSPLRSSPLRSSPLRSSELDATPLRSSPLRSSPLRSSPLRSSPLSELPLLQPDGWAELLAGTKFEGLALQTVRFGDVLDLDPSPLDGLSMDDIDWSNSALKRASVVGFLFGGLELDQFPGSSSWCADLAPDFSCAEHGITPSSTLLELDLAGAPLDALSLPAVQMDQIDWSGGTNTPVYHFDLLFVDVAGTPIGDLLIGDLPPGICSDIPGGFQCDTPGSTLADAVAAGAIPDYDLTTPEPPILGRILQEDDLVGGTSSVAAVTLGDVLPMLVDPAKLDLGGVSLFRLLSGLPAEGDLVTYEATAAVPCPDIGDFTMVVTLPAGFRYVPGSTDLGLDGAALLPDATVPEPPEGEPLPPVLADGPEPTPQRQPFTYAFQNVLACDAVGTATVQLSFDVLPYVELSEPANGDTGFPASLDLYLGDAEEAVASLADTARFTVFDPAPEGGRSVEPGSLYLGWLPDGKGTEDFVVTFEGSTVLEPGTLVTAVLSHLPADYDLRIDGPSSAPLRSSPLRSSPLRSSPLRSSPIEDEGLSGDPNGQQVPSDDLQDVPTTDETLTASANRGTEQDVVSTVVTASTAGDPLTIGVSSYLGSASNEPYTLQVFVDPPPELNCDAVALDRAAAFAGGTSESLPPGPGEAGFTDDARTLVLYNQERLEALYSPEDLDDILAAWQDVAAHDAGLDDGRQVKPLLLNVDGDADVRAAYAAWDADPCAPEAANDVVRSILEVTDGYVAGLPDLRFVTIVGGDDIIPSARIPDLVTLSNQRDYYQELVFSSVDNPLSAAQAMSYVTSDSAYTDLDPIDWLGHQLLIPDLAGGRLVETPTEIVGAIDQYLAQPYVATDASLVTAYDFLTHGGADTQASLEDLVGAGNATALISDDWSKADVLAELALSDPDLIAINAHYDHSRSLPAIGDQQPIPADELLTTQDILPDEILQSGLSAGALFFTVGCNAGINVPALAGVGLDETHGRLLDWAQAVAQIEGAGLFANTGFGYGDTEVSAYSERLMSLFAEHLDGTMTVGQAAVAARKAYVAELGLLGVYDDKSLTEATLYGLPFMRVGANGGSLPAEEVNDPFAGGPDLDVFTGPEADDGIEDDALPGVKSAPFEFDPDLERVDVGRGSYWNVVGEHPLRMHYRPLQPSKRLTLPAPPEDHAIGDVLITGLTSTVADPDVDAVFSRPTVDDSAFEPEPIIRDLAFPSTIGTVTPEASLVLMPGQYRGEQDPTTGQQILYTKVQGKVYYPPAAPEAGGFGTAAADEPERPFFTAVEGIRQGGRVDFRVEVDPADYVLVLYRQPDTDAWGSLELSPQGGRVWTGSVSPDTRVVEFFVQAVSSDGLVGAARGKGFDFLPLLGDMTPPTIEITVPTPNQEFAVGEVVSAEYACSDEEGGSGIDVCTAWDPVAEAPTTDLLDTSGGPKSFTVRAVDLVGNETFATVNYGAGYLFEGFFDPVKNPPVVNEVKAGQGVPLKFRLRTADGSIVSDLSAVIVPPKVVVTTCVTGETVDPVESDATASTAGLRFDGDQFIYTWQTDKKWKNSCRRLELRTDDGRVHTALFRFR